jgi:hypothetical protein
MGDVALPEENEVMYLGMYFDRRLTWAKQVRLIKIKEGQLQERKNFTGDSEEDQHYQ